MIDWRVLLIGGASGSGKTILAQRLSHHLDAPVLLADDIRMAIQGVTSFDQLPDLHFFMRPVDFYSLPPETICDGWRRVGTMVSKALEQVIAHHIVVEGVGRVIIEGDGILPGVAAQTEFAWAGEVGPGMVRGLFLHEPDEIALLANMRQRRRGFETLSSSQQENFARAAWTFGDWLKTEAERLLVPVLSARPWETLEDRALQIPGPNL